MKKKQIQVLKKYISSNIEVSGKKAIIMDFDFELDQVSLCWLDSKKRSNRKIDNIIAHLPLNNEEKEIFNLTFI